MEKSTGSVNAHKSCENLDHINNLQQSNSHLNVAPPLCDVRAKSSTSTINSDAKVSGFELTPEYQLCLEEIA